MIKVLNHISFARDWLDRAEEKIKVGSCVDGEVYLSLAESEVRKAWENSYDSRNEKKTTPVKKGSFSLIMGIILIFAFVVGTSYFYTPVNKQNQIDLNLSEGYRNREVLYSEGHEMRLINVNFMIDSNYDRGQQNGS